MAKTTGARKFSITDTKLSIPIVTLSVQDNIKLLKRIELGFNRTTNWSKCKSKVSTQARNEYLNYLVDQNFQGVNRRFRNYC